MGAKKKKKGGKKKEKKSKEDGEEPEPENPLFTVVLPEYGWIRIELVLCDAPTQKYNSFRVVMRTDDRILELKKRIIDFHGRVENVHIYNRDPYPPRNKKDNFRMTQKPRVPPFRELPRIKALMVEKEIKDKKEADRLKKEAEEGKNSDDEKKVNIYAPKEDPHKFDIITQYDYPVDAAGENIVEYDHKEISFYEIFGTYGTVARPKLNPKDDPPEPPKKEKKIPVKPPTPPPKKEDDEEEGGEGEGAEGAEAVPVEEEEPEEVFIPPVDRVLFYYFSAHNGKDPILLALMVKGEKDLFTL